MRKKRNRAINTFNISMLDVISGALGAFLIIMIILFPNYVNFAGIIEQLEAELENTRVSLAQAAESLDQAQAAAEAALQRATDAEERLEELAADTGDQRGLEARLVDAERRADAAEQRATRAEALLARTFLVVYVRWGTRGQDVDLHVVDPQGGHFFWNNRRVDPAGRRGELAEDNTRGPGNEVWEVRDAMPGDYHIRLNLYSRGGEADQQQNPEVTGRVFYRDGSSALGPVILRNENGNIGGPAEAVLLATVNVRADGSVTVR